MEGNKNNNKLNPILQDHIFRIEFYKNESSINDRKNILNNFFKFIAERNGLDSDYDVTEEIIEKTTYQTILDYEKYLKSINNSNNTIRLKMIFIRTFFKDFIERTHTHKPMDDPFFSYKLPKQNIKDIKLFNIDYYANFLYKLTGPMTIRNKAIVAILMTMGLKLHELCSLKMNDLYTDNNQLFLKIENRRLPVNVPAKKYLDDYLVQRNTLPVNNISGPIFISQRNKGIHRNTVELMLKFQAKAQDIDPNSVTAFALRKLAVNSYKHAGGGESGMRDYFGFCIVERFNETTNKEAFLHNEMIDYLEKYMF